MSKKNLLALQEFATSVIGTFDDELVRARDQKRPIQRTDNWASDLSHPCVRNLFYCRTRWDERQSPDIELLYRFEEGNEIERKAKIDLLRIGVKIVEEQVKFSWPEYQIVGRIDGRIILPEIASLRPPLEIKSVAPHVFDSIKSVQDIRDHDSFFIRKIFDQLDLYLLMTNEEFGFLYIKTFGKRPLFLPMMIDYDRGEELLKRAESVNASISKGIVPERIPYSASLCGRCAFNASCMPTREDQSADIPPQIIHDLRRREELRALSSEYEKLDKKVKTIVRGKNALIEEFEITSKEYETTFLDVPDSERARFERKKKAIRVSIERIS